MRSMFSRIGNIFLVFAVTVSLFFASAAYGFWVEFSPGSATGGGLSNSTDSSEQSAAILSSAGNPIVAWNEGVGGNREIYVLQWNGSAWVEIGAGSAIGNGVSNSPGNSAVPSLRLYNGNPMVAWQENNAAIYAKNFNGTNWVSMSTGFGGSIAYGPEIIVNGAGDPIAAWENYDGSTYQVYVSSWNGSSWVALGAGSNTGGGISNTSGWSEWPQIALNAAGNPVVVWWDSTPGNKEIYSKYWDGSAWTQLGGSATAGGISNNSGDSYAAFVASDLLGNPVVAWTDNSSGNYEIYVKKWNGSAWEDIGASSSSGGGISNNAGTSSYPNIAFDLSGNPIIAWNDNTSGDYEIYIKRFDGANWVEIDPGSASGGGISDNTGDSYEPKVLINSSGEPIVVFQDGSNGNYEIYAKKWVPIWNQNTPSGSNVTVNCDDITVTFPQVTSPGTTAATASPTGDALPSKYRLGNPPVYFDISTTATYGTPVQVCLKYSGIQYGSYSSLKLFHRTNGWHNITTSLDTVNEIICGETDSLSPFAIFEPYSDATNIFAPTATGNYMGDADGNMEITLADLSVHRNQILLKSASYDTIQPQTGNQKWNTCDVDGNKVCTLADISLLSNAILLKPVSISDGPWALENVDLPSSGNASRTWIPFTINLYNDHPTSGKTGRPGVTVVAEIDPASPGHGRLNGRSCSPAAGSRDQAAPFGSQCALSVTVTDWDLNPEIGITELDPFGFSLWGQGDGDVKINFRVEADPTLDIPATTMSVTVSF